jgi:hypothetical protein
MIALYNSVIASGAKQSTFRRFIGMDCFAIARRETGVFRRPMARNDGLNPEEQ